MEQVLDWLNENELRAYPLLDDNSKKLLVAGQPWILADGKAWELSDDFLLDLQLIIKDFSLHTTTTVAGHANVVVSRQILLKKLKLTSSNTVEVTFETEVDNISILVEKFEITSPNTQTYPLYLRTSKGNLAVFGSGIQSFIAVAATLVDVDVLANIPIEPSTSVQFNDAWLGVSSVSTSPEKKTQPLSYEPLLPIDAVSQTTHLVGDINFLAGYNFRVNIYNNLIDLEIGGSYGLVMTCDKHFIHEEYRDCHKLVSYINGVPPDADGVFRLLAGSNIDIVAGQTLGEFSDNIRNAQLQDQHEIANAHTLFVGLTFSATDLCAPINVKPSIG
jgi:hypothetical protein